MSECVVRMEMPSRCYDCDMANGLTCMATGGVYGRDVPKMTWIRRRPDWCPILCQLPEGHGRLVDADKPFLNVAKTCMGAIDYRSTIAERIGEDSFRHVEVIVPAERSET